MKRIIVLVLGVGTLGTAVYVGSRLWAQGGGAPASPQPQTRIALLNFGYVFKNYDKCKNLQDHFKGQWGQHEASMAKMKKELNDMKVKYDDPKTPATEKEQLEAKMRKLQHDIADQQDMARVNFGKAASEQTTTVFKEIENMAARYAAYKGIELVMHYNDPSGADERYNPKMLEIRTAPGVCMPLYAAAGMDISKEVTDYLNTEYKKSMPSASKPPTQE